MQHNVIVMAGPAGSGKDSIVRELIKRYPNKVEFGVNATSRAPRPGEQHSLNYFFFSNDEFKKEMEAGNIPEHYHRVASDTYYGLYKPDLDRRLAEGKIVGFQIQIVGAKYLKEFYNATTFFIMPTDLVEFERRVRSRAPMSDLEWQERKEFTEREIRDEAPWYDYRITNPDGKLSETVDQVVEILKKEGFVLE
jgi:guanylate kinase